MRTPFRNAPCKVAVALATVLVALAVAPLPAQAQSAPVANDDAYTTPQDQPLVVEAPGVLGNDTDADGDPLFMDQLPDEPDNGTIETFGDGGFTYTPNAGYLGTDTFTYQVTDAVDGSDIGTVTITVGNSPPVATDDPYLAQLDQTLAFPAPGVLANDYDLDGDTVTVTQVVDAPVNGSVQVLGDGSFTYIPDAGYSGTDTFTYEITDGTDTDIGTVTITVVDPAANHPPVASDDAYATPHDRARTIGAPGFLANDNDADGDNVTFTQFIDAPANGSVQSLGEGSFTYTPDAGYSGTDTFTYQITDGTDTDIGTVSIIVAAAPPVNNPPVANDDAYSTARDQTLVLAFAGVLDNDTDADSDFHLTRVADFPDHGDLNLFIDEHGSFFYIPDAGYVGTDSFTYEITDGIDSDIGTVTLTVEAPSVNNPPVANDNPYTVDQDEELTVAAPGILGNDTDADGDPVTFTHITDGPVGGDVNVNSDGRFRYTPDTGYVGTDSFDYQITDGTDRAEGTVTITVEANNRPVANDDPYTTPQDQALVVAAPGVLGNDTDVDGDHLFANSVTNYPDHGLLTTSTNGSFTYIPNAGYTGTDTFNYVVTDFTDTDVGTVTITVGNPPPPNNPPVAVDNAYTTQQDQILTVAAPGVLGNDTDADGDTLTVWDIPTFPAHGMVLTGTDDGAFTYIPDLGYTGTDTFTYRSTDGVDYDTATVTITVQAPANHPPVANDDPYTVRQGKTLTVAAPGILANDTDGDGDHLVVTGWNPAAHGSAVAQPDGRFSYIPAAGFSGTDTVRYQISDGTDHAVGTITITVEANNPPVAVDNAYTTPQDQALSVAAPGVLGNDSDADGDTLTVWDIPTYPAHGMVLTGTDDGAFTYIPDLGYTGTDTFTYRNTDGVDYDTATVTITIQAPANHPPVAVDDPFYRVGQDDALTIFATGALGYLNNDTDADGDPLTATLTGTPSHGTVIVNAIAAFTYTPDAGYTGTDSFTYQISDGTDTDEATITITVEANNRPVPHDDDYTVAQGQTLDVAAPGFLDNDTDVDGDQINLSQLVDRPDHGTVAADSAGHFIYTPNSNFAGTDSFTYICQDGLQTSASLGTVTITVTHTGPSAPFAVDDPYTTTQDQPLDVAAPGILANDIDFDGDPITFTGYGAPSHGTVLAHANGSFTYTPNAGYTGTDTFIYQIFDGTWTDIGTVTITIQPPPTNHPPVAVDDPFYRVGQDDALTIFATGALGYLNNDTDADGDPLTATLTGTPSHGTVIVNAIAAFTYTPDAGYTGTDSFTYQISDGTDTDEATITITVEANNRPVPHDDDYTVAQGQTLDVAAPGFLDNDTDVDGDQINLSQLVDRPDHGTVAADSAGHFIYTPNSNFAGTDSFTYICQDGLQTSASLGTVTITVTHTGPSAPFAVDDPYTTTQDQPLDVAAPGILANDIDFDGDPITFTGYGAPSHGTVLAHANGSFTYTPNAGYTGTDTFIYQIFDGTWTDIGTVTITIQPPPTNHPPVAVDDPFYRVGQDDALTIFATGALGYLNNDTDADGDPLTATLTGTPSHGTVIVNAIAAFTYTPDAGYTGTDSFTYQISDGTDTDEATITITVEANNRPVPHDDDYTVAQGQTLDVAAPGFLDNDTDVDGDQINLSQLVDRPDHGTVAADSAGHFIYTPNSNFAGTDSFTYICQDGLQTSASLGTVTITVTHTGPSAPFAVDDPYTTTQDQPLDVAAPGILANDIDFDGDPITFTGYGAPSHGTVLAHANGSFTYTPNAGYTGTDTFIYQIFDGTWTDIGTVTITIQPPPTNHPPVAVDDPYTTVEGTALTIFATGALGYLNNDTDPDADALRSAFVGTPSHGTFDHDDDGSFTYTPDPGYTGTDSFTYLAFDGLLISNTATVTITVTPSPTPLAISVSDAAPVAEPPYGGSPVFAEFAVDLSKAAATPVSVRATTAFGTALAGSDFRGTNTVLTFAPGETHKIVRVPILGSAAVEPQETFQLRLRDASGAPVADDRATGTILADPADPTVSVADAPAVSEPAGTVVNAQFVVALSAPSAAVVKVRASTANGTALSGSDYTAKDVVLTFQPGQTTKTVNVRILRTPGAEPVERFTLRLSEPSRVTIADGVATGTILAG